MERHAKKAGDSPLAIPHTTVKYRRTLKPSLDFRR